MSTAAAVPDPLPGASGAAPRFCAGCGRVREPVDDPCACETVAAPASSAAPLIGSVRTALTLYFALLAVILLTTVAGAVGDPLSARGEVALDTAYSIAAALVVIGGLVAARRELHPLVATPGPARWYALAPVLALGTFALAHTLVTAANGLLDAPELHYSLPYQDAGFPWWLPLVVIAVCPAVIEEIAFRGVIATSLERVMGVRESFFVTAVLFATIHLSPLAFIHLLVIGLALGWVRRAAGSLYPCMLLHFVHNGLCIGWEYLG